MTGKNQTSPAMPLHKKLSPNRYFTWNFLPFSFASGNNLLICAQLKFFRGAAPDPEDILLDLFGGEAASLRAVRRLLRGRLPPRPRAADAYRATLYSSGTGLAKTVRKPRRLPRTPGASLLRFAERQYWALLPQPPPRLTRPEPPLLSNMHGSLAGDVE